MNAALYLALRQGFSYHRNEHDDEFPDNTY